jgi:hypothetical protein
MPARRRESNAARSVQGRDEGVTARDVRRCARTAGRVGGRTALRVVDRRTAADRIAVCSWKGFFRRRP